jgi:hypothetical protein
LIIAIKQSKHEPNILEILSWAFYDFSIAFGGCDWWWSFDQPIVEDNSLFLAIPRCHDADAYP